MSMFPALVLLILFSFCYNTKCQQETTLDRDQLAILYPNYASETRMYIFLRNITTIDSLAFSSLYNLEYLYLSYNLLANISSVTFKDLFNLRELNLDSNRISFIESLAFENLRSLTYLRLDNNQLAGRLDPSMFNSLTNLGYLYLHYNKLTTIDGSLFSRLRKLKYLWLHSNNIISIDRLCLVGLLDLQEVWIGYNPIVSLMPSYVQNLCTANPRCTIDL